MSDNVEQVDRDAAAKQWNRQNQPLIAERCALGRADNSLLVQAFAAHRIEATRAASEREAEMVEALEHARDFIDNEEALNDHQCEGPKCQKCKRRTAAFVKVNTALKGGNNAEG